MLHDGRRRADGPQLGRCRDTSDSGASKGGWWCWRSPCERDHVVRHRWQTCRSLLLPLGTSGHPRGAGATKCGTWVNAHNGLTARLVQVLGPGMREAVCRQAVPTERGRRGFVMPMWQRFTTGPPLALSSLNLLLHSLPPSCCLCDFICFLCLFCSSP